MQSGKTRATVEFPCWERYPRVRDVRTAREWLSFCAKRGLAANTIDAYGRALNDFLGFGGETAPEQATRHDVAAYLAALRARPSVRRRNVVKIDSGSTLSNATLHQKLTAIRLYFDYLIEEGLRTNNPVGRGRYTPGRSFARSHERGLIPRFHKLPWIPTEEQWKAVVEVVKGQPLRTRVMFALGYDAALRREELCRIGISDIDPSHRLLRIPAENTKNRRSRSVPFSKPTAELYAAYIRTRRQLSRSPGALFLSESRRNLGSPLSIWTWSKAISCIAAKSEVPELTTHTLRHLRLTDLARAGWDVHEIAALAGHRNVQTTMLYIHLSGRELATKLDVAMAHIHAWRAAVIA
jgi:site-specific recombinase XerD